MSVGPERVNLYGSPSPRKTASPQNGIPLQAARWQDLSSPTMFCGDDEILPWETLRWRREESCLAEYTHALPSDRAFTLLARTRILRESVTERRLRQSIYTVYFWE